jgi:predicted O-methyltransferase YrrM
MMKKVQQMDKVNQTIKFFKYKMLSKHRHGFGIHSPFVFDLLVNVIEHTDSFYAYPSIESLRYRLLSSSKVIKVCDYGAGSHNLKQSRRKVCSITEHSCVKPKFGKLLFRLVNRFQPETVLELGTSIGLSTLYLASPNSKTKIYTIEGCPETAQIAMENFHTMNVKNVHLIKGKFEDKLSGLLKEIETIDFVFFDGNHQYNPTISYFEECLKYARNNSIFVFDDIHWSDEMELAWKQIQNNEKVKVTIDLFYMGLVFFRKELSKQNFLINF